MKEPQIIFLKYISMIQRNTKRYFDAVLENEPIGSGQQFFLSRIYENEGITMCDLAKIGQYDKGTVTKAIKKLVDIGYVSIVADEHDKRVRHLYTTKKAEDIINHTYELRDIWKKGLLSSLTNEEKENFISCLEKMAKSSNLLLNEFITDKEEKTK